MSDSVPKVTRILDSFGDIDARAQHLVLDTLAGNHLSGRQLRSRLAQLGLILTEPLFWALMRVLEETHHVRGRDRVRKSGGVPIPIRFYTIAPDGLHTRDMLREGFRRSTS
jgi:hypothetical protein